MRLADINRKGIRLLQPLQKILDYRIRKAFILCRLQFLFQFLPGFLLYGLRILFLSLLDLFLCRCRNSCYDFCQRCSSHRNRILFALGFFRLLAIHSSIKSLTLDSCNDFSDLRLGSFHGFFHRFLRGFFDRLLCSILSREKLMLFCQSVILHVEQCLTGFVVEHCHAITFQNFVNFSCNRDCTVLFLGVVCSQKVLPDHIRPDTVGIIVSGREMHDDIPQYLPAGIIKSLL